MEFPHLGQHCSESSCKTLDFLPLKCDSCDSIFCKDHIMYLSHSCKESYKKDNQIPVCPLCNLPIPLKKGELPDVVVGHHIESDCQSDPAKSRRKVYTNKCSKKGCKQKELIPVKCETCLLNFCLRHRHESDHACQGFADSRKPVSKQGAAAIFRHQQQATTSNKIGTRSSVGSSSNAERHRGNLHTTTNGPARNIDISPLQGSISQDEALARAMAASMNGNGNAGDDPLNGMTAQEREDFLLAQALSLSEQETSQGAHETRYQRQEQRSVDRCLVQ